MDASRFDAVSKFFAQRSLSRRDAMIAGGTALAATGLAADGLARTANAQEATPAADATTDAAEGPAMLFVQTFQSGTIAPAEGEDGRYTLTLEAGTGQTIYFSDRPDRLVGANPTPQFLEGLGFPDDNPPNAALVVETAPGETDVAVVELFSPLYDPVSQGVTYEVEVLENWQDELGVGLHEAPADLAALAPSFGAAHLFIDGLLDCPDGAVVCRDNLLMVAGTIADGFCSRTITRPGAPEKITNCYPCSTPDDLVNYYQGHPELVWRYWSQRCNETFPERNDDTIGCEGGCTAFEWCEPDPYVRRPCPVYP